jgi:hypothetical protein
MILQAENDTSVVIRPPKDSTRNCTVLIHYLVSYHLTITVSTDEAHYSFTKVFDTTASQQQVFETAAIPLVRPK